MHRIAIARCLATGVIIRIFPNAIPVYSAAHQPENGSMAVGLCRGGIGLSDVMGYGL